MNKKTKKTFVRRRVREFIEIRQDQDLVLFCKNCLSEQRFELIDKSQKTQSIKESEKHELHNPNLREEE